MSLTLYLPSLSFFIYFSYLFPSLNFQSIHFPSALAPSLFFYPLNSLISLLVQGEWRIEYRGKGYFGTWEMKA